VHLDSCLREEEALAKRRHTEDRQRRSNQHQEEVRGRIAQNRALRNEATMLNEVRRAASRAAFPPGTRINRGQSRARDARAATAAARNSHGAESASMRDSLHWSR